MELKKNIVKYGIFKQKINRGKVLKQFYSQFPTLKHKEFLSFSWKIS